MSQNRRSTTARSVESVGASIEAALSAAADRIRNAPAIDVWQEWQPRSDAEVLLERVLGKPVTQATLRGTLTASEVRAFDRLVARRVSGEPVALVTGRIVFDGLELHTRPGVFVPRLSSELAAREAGSRLRRFAEPVAVDIATGTGPIALSMARRVPAAEVWGLDIAANAVALGRANARRLGLSNAHFRVSDLLHALPRALQGRVAIITIHPPYVAGHEVATLPDEIRRYEPAHTLTDTSDDGLGLVRALADDVPRWLRPGGWWLVEVGTHLHRKTQAIMRRAGLVDVSWTRDSIGVTRVVTGRRPRA